MEWWKKNIIYHIYLPSFKDSNNDGIGDIPGLIQKLDYFKEMRIKSLLLSPFFPSPMKDNGYDVSSYTEIDPKFGTLEDFDNLMTEVKRRKLNIILDLVANHTSDKHPWFERSIQKEDPYTNFYIWVDPKPGEGHTLPNNWLSVFGGPAWTWNEQRQQFYFHQFLPEQPDLNFRNSAVKREMEDVLKFWLEKGVDGFRVDAASHLFEDHRLLDEPVAKQTKAKENEHDFLNHIYTKGQPETFKLIEEWRKVLDRFARSEKKEKILLVECMEEVEDIMHYYGTLQCKRAEIPMNFLFYKVTSSSTGVEISTIIDSWIKNMPKGKFPNWVMSSHDFPRVASRVGKNLSSSLFMIAMLLPGIPIIYYGDELGMENGLVTVEQTRDSFALRTELSNSRDPMRTPMLWNNCKNAGFSDDDEPWLPVHQHYEDINVEAQKQNASSYLMNFRKLIALREEPCISYGKFKYLLVNEYCFSFLRSVVKSKCLLVVVNVSSSSVRVDLSRYNSENLPSLAQLELTNPEFYSATVSLYMDSTHSGNVAHSSQPDESISIPLNNILLQGHQGMVLSYNG